MDESRKRLEDVITILVSQSRRHLTRTSMVKLLYFVDLRSYEARGRPITNLSWIWHHYGPFAEGVAETVGALEAAGELGVSVGIGFYGGPEYTIRTGPHAGLFGVLTSDEVSLLQRVIDEFGRHSATVLRNLSYQTWPIREARNRGVELDFRQYQHEES